MVRTTGSRNDPLLVAVIISSFNLTLSCFATKVSVTQSHQCFLTPVLHGRVLCSAVTRTRVSELSVLATDQSSNFVTC